MARTNVAVVCAGAKAILDIPKTLEYLETMGVPTIGYKTTSFPTFYTASSAYPIEYFYSSVSDIAQIIQTKWSLKINGGVLVLNPISSRDEITQQDIEPAICQAILEAEQQQISGKALTPFLLTRIGQLTGDKSLHANISLLKNNAGLGAQLAVAIASSDTMAT